MGKVRIRSVTAAGPSRVFTGVPCLSAEKDASGQPPTHISWGSLVPRKRVVNHLVYERIFDISNVPAVHISLIDAQRVPLVRIDPARLKQR
jgi:hypothetical protein